MRSKVDIWVAKPVTLLMRTHKNIKHHFSALNITPKGHLLFSSVDRKESSQIIASHLVPEFHQSLYDTFLYDHKHKVNTEIVFLLESSLFYICVNTQDDYFQPIKSKLLAFQPQTKKPCAIRFQTDCENANLRKLIRFGDYILGFAIKEYFVFDSSLTELSRRTYLSDHIEGNFGSASLSFDHTHVLLLFGGIYFVQLVSSQQPEATGRGNLHLV